MAQRISPIRVISFSLLAVCGALCQSEPPSAALHQGSQLEGPNPPEVQSQETRRWRSLPDAPSAIRPPTRAEQHRPFIDQAGLPATLSGIGIPGIVGNTELGHVTPRLQLSFTSPDRAAFTERQRRTFLDKYLYPSLLKQNLRYHPSTSSSVIGRTTYAASRIFITRDDSGNRRLNTSYFLAALTSVAIHTANRPYWARSSSMTFNNFGSTMGSDAGINVFHEFGPGIQQMMKGRLPKFVSRIQERITRDRVPSEVVSTPAK
jgi:hypothetical protein